MGFFLETLLGGLMAGMLYSLVALGFVLIFKASGCSTLRRARWCCSRPWRWPGSPNGSRAGRASRAPVRRQRRRLPDGWRRDVRAGLADRALGAAPPGQPGRRDAADGHAGHHLPLDGLGQTIFGSNIYKIDIGMPKEPIILFEGVFQGGILVNKEDVYAALIAAFLVALLSVFFQKTSTGRALRAVADDHQAAQSIGIPLNRIWVIVWCVAGITALVAGMIWGSKLGVQFSLTTVALRACR
jgi:branched-chain amino acid transport system permease protein